MKAPQDPQERSAALRRAWDKELAKRAKAKPDKQQKPPNQPDH